jgi:hypothetical protein
MHVLVDPTTVGACITGVMRHLLPIAFVLAFGLGGAAFGEDEQPASERAVPWGRRRRPIRRPTPTAAGAVGGAKAVIHVSVGEWFVKPDRAKADAGPIEFEVANDGTIAHEVEVVKTGVAPHVRPTSGEKG